MTARFASDVDGAHVAAQYDGLPDQSGGYRVADVQDEQAWADAQVDVIAL